MDAPPFDLDEYCGGLRGNKDEMDVTVRAFHVPGLASKSASARRACVQQIFVVVTSRRWVQLRAVNAETSGPASKYWASAGARLVARDFRLDPMESCMFHDAVNVARAALQGRTIERHDPVDEMKFMARVMVDVERKMADKGIEAVARELVAARVRHARAAGDLAEEVEKTAALRAAVDEGKAAARRYREQLAAVADANAELLVRLEDARKATCDLDAALGAKLARRSELSQKLRGVEDDVGRLGAELRDAAAELQALRERHA